MCVGVCVCGGEGEGCVSRETLAKLSPLDLAKLGHSHSGNTFPVMFVMVLRNLFLFCFSLFLLVFPFSLFPFVLFPVF